MPFDCTPLLDLPLPQREDVVVKIDSTTTLRVRPIPPWHVSRRVDGNESALAVLVRARQLLADERCWCQGAFARTWLNLPVPSRFALARRYCALGAIMRAGRELGLPTIDAQKALEWQTVISVADWNDDRLRTHGDVLAAFDATIVALA